MYELQLSIQQGQIMFNATRHINTCFSGLPQAAARTERRRSKRLTADRVDASEPPTSTQKTSLHLHRAMDTYDLTGSELLCELKRDTRCLMGWGDSTIVLAFRGTASVTNALSDLQVRSLQKLALQQSRTRFACWFVHLCLCVRKVDMSMCRLMLPHCLEALLFCFSMAHVALHKANYIHAKFSSNSADLFCTKQMCVAGMEDSAPSCPGPQLALQPAPCPCGLPQKLAGWRLQPQGGQPDHGRCQQLQG